MAPRKPSASWNAFILFYVAMLIMITILDEEQSHGVPILADVKVGSNWEELKPVTLTELR